MPDLDRQLRETGARLFDEIRIPDLDVVRGRARHIRRRRRGLAAGASALALLLVVGLGITAIDRIAGRPAPVPAASDPTGTMWQGGGITLHGLDGPVLDQPGDLIDIQFADSKHGYALSAQCTPGCRFALAATTDGGHSWADSRLPDVAAPEDGPPRLVTVGPGVAIQASGHVNFATYPDPGWAQVLPTAVFDAVPMGGRLWAAGTECGTGLQAWSPAGLLGRLSTAPSITVCSVIPEPAADGAWWVGGRTPDGSAPAVAVSRDRGATWTVTVLPGSGTAQVTTLGGRVYATVVTPRGGQPYPETQRITAIFLSTNGGQFTPLVDNAGTVVGDVAPLLDGRLVAAGPDWQITGAPGTTFDRAGGSLPWVHRIVRTPGGWVAYDLFKAGWAAVSPDGETWQKLNLR